MTFSRCLTRTSPLRPPAGAGLTLAPAAATDGKPGWLLYTLELIERARGPVGIVYLLHFDRPIGDTGNPRGYAQHYTGWTLDLSDRLATHAAGAGPSDGGARLMQAVFQAGIGFQLARVWEGDRGLERTLKQRGAARRCPVCRLQTLGLSLPRRPENLVEALELGPAANFWAAGDLAVLAAGVAA
jgi:hypothetical protein